jgi:hypothetical protein
MALAGGDELDREGFAVFDRVFEGDAAEVGEPAAGFE